MASGMSIEELLINGRISPNYRSRVHSELVNVTKYYPGLSPRLLSYIDNMGNESLLITLQGTVPMSFRGNTYYTPVHIYIPTEYPNKPPIAFVRPSANMVIKQDHPNVTPNGECTHSYFTKWDPSFNSLTGAVKTLSEDFSKVSPLFSRAARPQAQPPRQYGQQPAQQPYPAAAAGKYPMTAQSPSSTPSSIPGSGSASGVYSFQPAKVLTPREQLSAKVRNRLARENQPALDLRKNLYGSEVELTRELAQLEETEKLLPQLSKEMDELKAEYDKESQSIEEQLKKFNTLKESGATSKIADAVVPMSGLSEQILAEYAKRDALEDVMYELMKRMTADNCDSMLRLIRNAASDQFVSVALIDKIQKLSTPAQGYAVPNRSPGLH